MDWLPSAPAVQRGETAAAQLLLSRLADLDQRAAALLGVQLYDSRLLPPRAAEIQKRGMAVLGRPDFREAVAKVGHVEAYHLMPDPP